MSIKIRKNTLRLRDKVTGEMQPVAMFGSGSDKTLEEIKQIAEQEKEFTVYAINTAAEAAKTGIEEKTDEQVARIPEVTELATDVNHLKGDLVDLENKIIVKPTDYGISGGYSVSKISGNANLSSNYDDRTNILTITKDAEVNVVCKISLTSLQNIGNYTFHFAVTSGNVGSNEIYVYLGGTSQGAKSLTNNTLDFSLTYDGNGIVGIAFVIPYSINTISITINSTLYGDSDKIICDDLSNRVANLETRKAEKTIVDAISKKVEDFSDAIDAIYEKQIDYGISQGYSIVNITGNSNLTGEYDSGNDILSINKDTSVNSQCKIVLSGLTNPGDYTIQFALISGTITDSKVYLYFGDTAQVVKQLSNDTIDFSFNYNGSSSVGIAFVIPYNKSSVSCVINALKNSESDKIICDNLSNRVANLESTKADKTEIKKITPTLANLAMFTKIATCGDSFTVGQVYVNNVLVGDFPQKSWGASMGRLIGADVSVYASGGANTDTWQTRSSCLPKLLQDEPHELYILALGINDYNGGHAGETRIETGTIADIHDDYTQNPNTFYGNYGKIIAQIKQHAPYAKILLCKSFNPENTGQYNYSSTACEEIAEHFEIAFVETINSVYMNSDFWIKHRDNHPTVIQYTGLGKEMLKLCEETIEKNIAYFMDFYPR